MKKQILNLGRALNKAEQKMIIGGTDPIDGGGGSGSGSGGTTDIGVCLGGKFIIYIPCDSVCPDGTDPICAA